MFYEQLFSGIISPVETVTIRLSEFSKPVDKRVYNLVDNKKISVF